MPTGALLGMPFIFAVFPEFYDPDWGYQVVTLHEDLLGVYPTNWYWGKDLELAMEYACDMNFLMGHSAGNIKRLIAKRYKGGPT